MMEIRKVSETASKMTLAWDPVPGATAGYRGRAEGVEKWTQTQQTQMVFAKGANVEIQALGITDSGVYPPVVEPPPTSGFAIPTFEVVVSGAADNNVLHQGWVTCLSPTTSEGFWGSYPCRQLRTPQHSSGIRSWEWWCLYEIFVPTSWNDADEGNMYALPHDWHNVPGDVGWSSGSGVSSLHTKFKAGGFELQQEYASPHIYRAPMSKAAWHSVTLRVIWGRLDGSVPSNSHPNGGAGRTRVWIDGATAIDTGDINNLQLFNGTIQKSMNIIEGLYCPRIGSARTARFTLARFGRTYTEALADSQVSNISVVLNEGFQPSAFNRIADRSSSQFVGP